MALRLVKAVAESGATRDLLIRGAEHQIIAKGIEGLTFRTLADALGIRVHTIYAYFSSAEDLISGVAAQYGMALTQLFEDDGLRDPTTVLLEGAGALVRHFAENPAHLRLELRDFETPDGVSAFSAGRYRAPMEWSYRLGSLESILNRGRAVGKFRATDAMCCYRAMVGVAMMQPRDAGHLSQTIALVRDVIERYVCL
jgi:AcrR family transcriptional regulator